MVKHKYMLDFWGKGDASQDTLCGVMESQEKDRFRDAVAGQSALGANVDKWLEAMGIEVTDRSIGAGGWQVGAPFDDLSYAVSMFRAAEAQFRQALAAGLLYVTLKTWSREAFEEGA